MEAVIFTGIQGAGKSSFYRERFFFTHVRINLDMLKTRHRERLLLHACLEARQPFVVDNTNPTREERVKYVAAARAAGFRIVGYYFETSVEDALRRNAQRPEFQRVPVVGVLGTRKRLEVPSPSEGYDALYVVRIGADDVFSVEAWRGGAH
jgi:predicted kinase